MTTLCRKLFLFVIILGVSVIINGCCVAAGTLIATPEGEKPVESLVVGDAVLTVSPSGNTERGRVVRIKRHLSLGCNTISLSNGKQIRVTRWHPVSTRSGWVKAGNLEKGQEIQTLTGFQRITDIKSELKLQTVYDLSIAPNPNFIADGVVVHNKTYATNISPENLPGQWAGFETGGYFGRYYRLELYPDGTGLFAGGYGPGLYKVRTWSTGEYTFIKRPYRFHAELEYIPSGQKAELEGDIGPSGILLKYREPDWPGGEYRELYVIRERHLEDGMRSCKEAMSKYRQSTKDPKAEKQ